MNTPNVPTGCACCGLSRRRFLAAGCAAACAGAGGILAVPRRARAAEDTKIKIRIVYSLHAAKQPGPDWPNVGFDFEPVMKRIAGELTRQCPGFEFTTAMAAGPEAAQKILQEDQGNMDGYVVYQMNCWNRVIQTIAASGKPVLYADFQYGGSGGFLVYTAGFLRSATPNVGFVASSRMEDVAAAVRCFAIARKGGSPADFVAATARVRRERTPKADGSNCEPDKLATLSPKECLAEMKRSKILAVEEGRPKIADAIRSEMGIEVVPVKFAELNAAWEAADKDASRELAAGWRKTAARVAGVDDATLETSAAMYFAQRAVLRKYAANAITINCLGGFYGKHIHAYPCLGFHQLLNDGLVGACECDIRSTATMVAMTALTEGRPGYISDPVIDTASRQIIYAHCVSSNRPFGAKGKASPFQILTHSEDRQGASVRAVLPLGYMTTTVEFKPEEKTILFHQARAVANVDDDRACRTKLAGQPVGDIEKLFTQWDQWGWHRVTVYGDLKEPVFALADTMGWKVLEEA